jgi:hypothetical protein
MYTYTKMKGDKIKSAEASRLRQRKYSLAQRFQIPAHLLPGSLSESHYRCGKKTCHCASDEGHSGWTLTFMVDGHKRVERIPPDWVDEVRQRVAAGREFQDAVREVLAANAQLLALERRQVQQQRKQKKP